MSVSGRISNTHGHNVGVVCGEGCGNGIAGGRGGGRRRGFTRGLSRRLVIVALEEVLDDSVLNEVVDQREDGSTGDTLVHNVKRGIENVTNTGLHSVAVQERSNCIGTLLVAVGLGANVGGRHTGALLLSGNEAVVGWGSSDTQGEWEGHQEGPCDRDHCLWFQTSVIVVSLGYLMFERGPFFLYVIGVGASGPERELSAHRTQKKRRA